MSVSLHTVVIGKWTLITCFVFVTHALGFHQYCLIGAGPAGLQMGYFLGKANRDYVIFEKTNMPGSFFEHYPRHRKLISINKINTGSTNKEFNFRHDWNSLIGDGDLYFKEFSRDFFPNADVILEYFQAYKTKYNIRVQYNTTIVNVGRDNTAVSLFSLRDQKGTVHTCKTVIVSTGIAIPNVPDYEGIENTIGYEDMPMNMSMYDGKTVLILGKGNSAFETGTAISYVANLVHLVSNRIEEDAWNSHYVGDVRAVNNELYDTFYLKSLDGLFVLATGTGMEQPRFVKDESSEKISIRFNHLISDKDNYMFRWEYDYVIRCTGFVFDFSIFDKTCRPKPKFPWNKNRRPKYPLIDHTYQAVDVPGLYFAGTVTHSLDFKKSSGGFLHGFRYTTQALHRILEYQNHRKQWPSIKMSISELLNHIIKRVNEASGLYQMFGVLSDVMILSSDEKYEYLEDYPIQLLPTFKNITGKEADRIIVFTLQYGSGEGVELNIAKQAHTSFFLHPMFHYYERIPTDKDMIMHNKLLYNGLPRPTKLHHITSDFRTSWSTPNSHILPLRRFLESCVGQDLRYNYDDECFQLTMTHKNPPIGCQQSYASGLRISRSA
ncbi:FAD-dependent oxidoreductase domain-containing protein 2-like [Saccoglossus kowalevskii]